MENVVAARRLRKSMLNDKQDYDFNIKGININSRYITDEKNDKVEKNKGFVFKIKRKMFIKVFLSVLIIFVCLIFKLLFKDTVKSNKYGSIIINQYKKDYSKQDVILQLDRIFDGSQNYLKYIIPKEDYEKFLEKYDNNFKDIYLNFKLKEKIKYVINGKNLNYDYKLDNANINISSIEKGGVIETFTKNVSNDENVLKILEKNIEISKPLEGKITSLYGEREKIFDDLSEFHTGVDIAASEGTDIKSATKGKVIKAINDDKYYGNYVVIENDGVTFKYAHMSKINVSENDEVNLGDIIGFVGSTGYSTGPHLHFEIAINSVRVNPLEILEL